MEEKVYVEEEIDLRELFLIVARKKYLILGFTLLITLLAVIYVSIKTPIYEVKSVVRVGYIGATLVENSNILETKLKLICGVDNKPIIKENEAIVSSILSVKKVENFLEITTQGYSNEQAFKFASAATLKLMFYNPKSTTKEDDED